MTCYLRQAPNFGKGVINDSWNFQVQKAQVTLQMGPFITFAVTFTWIRLKLMIHSLSIRSWSKASTTCLLPTRLLKCIVDDFLPVLWSVKGVKLLMQCMTLLVQCYYNAYINNEMLSFWCYWINDIRNYLFWIYKMVEHETMNTLCWTWYGSISVWYIVYAYGLILVSKWNF